MKFDRSVTSPIVRLRTVSARRSVTGFHRLSGI